MMHQEFTHLNVSLTSNINSFTISHNSHLFLSVTPVFINYDWEIYTCKEEPHKCWMALNGDENKKDKKNSR